MKSQSNKIIWVTFSVLVIYLIIDFYQKKEDNFWQFNYAWDQEKIIEEIEIDSIGQLNYNYVELSTSEKLSSNFNTNNVLKFIAGKQNYYFFYNGFQKFPDKVRFTSGFWLLEQPENIKYPRVQLIDLPLKQNGNIKVCTIVDSHLLWRGGRFFRKDMFEANRNMSFVGNKNDVFGFPYVGEILNKTSKTLNENIPQADYYIILLGQHDNANDFKNNFENLNNKVLNTAPQSNIIWMTVPPNYSKNKSYSEINSYLNSKNEQENFKIVDFSDFVNLDDKHKMIKDSIHYSRDTYKKVARFLSKKIK